MMKPDGMVETNHLTELIDKTEMASHIYHSLRELYGICYSAVVVDDRTGQIIEIGSKEYEELD